MKTYSYTKPELNLTIVITPKAWAWAERRYSTPAVYADHQAAQFLAGRPVDNDVVIEWITKPCETPWDSKAAGSQKRSADGQKRVTEVAPNASAPTIASGRPPAPVESAAGETVWLAHTDGTAVCFYPPGSKGMYYSRRVSMYYSCPVAKPNAYPLALRMSGPASLGWRRCTPAEASKWLRANGHASVADEIDAAEKYEPVGTLPVVGDSIRCSREHVENPDYRGVHVVTKIDSNARAAQTTHCYWPLDNFRGAYRVLKRKGKTNG